MKIVFEIVLYLFSILGGIVSIWTLYKWIKPLRRISWKRVEKGVVQLKNSLIQDNYHPTLIVGIGRGGSIIGALLSGVLGNTPIIVIDRIYRWSDHEREEDFIHEIKITKNLERVLLVAGELHSGNTAKKYKEYFNKIGANEIRMLTYMKESYPTFKPDYFYLETDQADIRLPWMISKDYKRESLKNYEKN